MTYEEEKQWAFLATRQDKRVEKKVKKYVKKNQKTGAGREVIYEKMTPEVQKKLDASRAKEWNNWKHYTNGKWVSEKDLKELCKAQGASQPQGHPGAMGRDGQGRGWRRAYHEVENCGARRL